MPEVLIADLLPPPSSRRSAFFCAATGNHFIRFFEDAEIRPASWGRAVLRTWSALVRRLALAAVGPAGLPGSAAGLLFGMSER